MDEEELRARVETAGVIVLIVIGLVGLYLVLTH